MHYFYVKYTFAIEMEIYQPPSGTILAIESSCDDTSVAIYVDGHIHSLVTSSQMEHVTLGGVVPEVASRAHLKNIVPVTQQAMKEANVDMSSLDAIACTAGPGLLGSLIVGVCFAKGLAAALKKPLITVNHLDAHIFSNFIETPFPNFPFLNLTVSGGHTDLAIIHDFDHIELLGRTIDDAAGEAFDKIGKMLGYDYPAGPLIDKDAQKGEAKYAFTISNLDDYQFTFSGLKTAVLYYLQNQLKEDADFIKKNKLDIAASIQHTITEQLTRKVKKALENQQVKGLCVAGGVSANSSLRLKLKSLSEEFDLPFFAPAMAHCTDNAAMIAVVAAQKYKNGATSALDIAPFPR